MIATSADFKSSIKAFERKIKGYVDILYNANPVQATATTNMASTYGVLSEITNGARVKNQYGSLDYLPLDGSMLVLGDTNTNIGFISRSLFNGMLNNPTITLSFTSTTLKGITMYFRTNIPTNMTIAYSDGTTQTISDNTDETVQVIFASDKTLTGFTITINNVMHTDRKIYIVEIDLGISQTYLNNDLLEFTIDEEVDKLGLEIPTNEATIVLNNMNDIFNPLNPEGIIPYLSENTLIIPYIGVETEDLGVEYVKMGEFYFDSYTNNADKTTTLIGKNIIKKLDNINIVDGLKDTTVYYLDATGSSYANTTEAIIDKAGLQHNITLTKRYTNYLTSLKNTEFMNYIKDFTAHNFGVFYANRNNVLTIKNPQSSNVDTITKSELITDVDYVVIPKINTIKRKGITMNENLISPISIDSMDYIIFDYEFTLKSTEEIITVPHQNLRMFVDDIGFSADFEYTGATNAEILFDTNFFSIIKVQGTANTKVKLTAKASSTYKDEERENIVSNRQSSEKEVVLETLTQLDHITTYSSDGSSYEFSTANGQLNYAPSYEMRFDYNGDPSLEAGDYISVQTPYGYKNLFIEKHRIRFDGGLEASIEGVE